jgi:hypothetical protein
MPESKLSAHVATVRAYLATKEGKREMKRLGLAFGLSYQAALAQQVVVLCGVERYKDIQAIVDEVLIVELVA